MERDTASQKSKAPSVAPSAKENEETVSQMAARIEEDARADIKKRYVPLIPADQAPTYKPKMVGLNPRMRPPVTASRANLFPMAGLWSQKKLLVTSN